MALARLKNSVNQLSQRKTKPLSEAHIQATCTAWLALDNWRAIETDPKHLRGLGVSEPGMPDRQYIRYVTPPLRSGPENILAQSQSETMWIEWKKKGGKAAQHQKDWHARERARGALTLIAGEDFEASISGFAEWYQKSGLQRKSFSVPR